MTHLGMAFLAALRLMSPQVPERSAAELSLLDKNVYGPLALACAASHLGRPDAFDAIFEVLPADGRLRSFHELADAANKVGLKTRAIRWRTKVMPQLPGPAIIRLDPSAGEGSGHFVVLLGASGSRVLVLDLPYKPKWVPVETLGQVWDGVALHVARQEGPLPEEPSSESRRFVAVGCSLLSLLVLGLIARSRSDTRIVPVAESQGASRPFQKLIVLSATAAGMIVVTAWAWAWSMTKPETGVDRLELVAVPPSRELTVAASDYRGSPRKVSFVYKIVNRGTFPANVEGVSTSCGCAAPIVSGRVIEPGKSIEVTANVVTKEGQEQAFKLYVQFGRPHDRTVELSGRLVTD